jgi:hypothetical protein
MPLASASIPSSFILGLAPRVHSPIAIRVRRLASHHSETGGRSADQPDRRITSCSPFR